MNLLFLQVWVGHTEAHMKTSIVQFTKLCPTLISPPHHSTPPVARYHPHTTAKQDCPIQSGGVCGQKLVLHK